ncbi:MAG: hypothetical protein PHQ66_00205 [Candidatus Nanoarchaeia archaeon]|nr:hypothetical protein [Candidatus Nanoarchaeia archaeon]MDD5358130.1 hypothetical protein [Candidatus Nanoarchaeia archaeon]MDD5589317.1 hypothetical protein [Candidatus Nanoarchaeia archaeon]
MEKKQIVIIESSPTDTLAKIAKGLKKKGYEVIFISLVSDIERDFIKESYDKTISFNAKFFKINISNFPEIFFHGLKNFSAIIKSLYEITKLKPYVIIGRAPPNWLCTIFAKYFKKYPFIYFPYDIRSFSYPSLKDALSNGVPKFEINSEKYCFENTDGIIHKGDENELNILNKTLLGDINIACPTFYFFPYCLGEFAVPLDKTNKISLRQKGIHLVYVGHVPDDSGWIEGLNNIINQGIYLHLYSRTNNIPDKEEKQRVMKVLKDSLKKKFLVLHDTVSQKELSKEISKYDYGIYSYCISGKKGYSNATGNKIPSYLEAGLPVIYPDYYLSAGKFLEDSGVGIKLSNFNKLKKILKKNNPSKFEKNILKTRDFLSIENQVGLLENFFKQVICIKHNLWKKKD